MLLTYSVSALPHVNVPALIILGMMFLNGDCSVCSIDDQALSIFSTKLSEAATSTSLCTEVGYIGLSASELVRGASGLALNETFAAGFMEREIVQALLNMLTKVTDEDQFHILMFIWSIATHSKLNNDLHQIPKLLDNLNFLSGHIPIAKCALLKIQGWNVKGGKVKIVLVLFLDCYSDLAY